MKKSQKILWTAVAFTIMALAFTVVVMKVDVRPIGPLGSKVGLSFLNEFAVYTIKFNMLFYKISDIFGYLSVVIAVTFAIIGRFQWFMRKSIRKVDKSIIGLGFLYAFLLIFYALSNKIIVNYRPIIIDNILKASFPSSHTVMAIGVLGSFMMEIGQYIKDKKLLKKIKVITFIVLLRSITTRLLSGIHWISDIIAGILYGTALVLYFGAFLKSIQEKGIR